MRILKQLLVVVLINGQTLFPADSDSSSLDSSPEIGAYPVIFYSDRTRMAGGVGSQFVFEGQTEQQSSSISLIAFYTQNRQYVLQSRSEIFLKEGIYKLSGGAGYIYFPDTFYGIGNKTGKDYEDFTSRLLNFNPTLQKKVYSNLYAGFQFSYYHSKLIDLDKEGELIKKTVSGSKGGVVSGLGVNASWDSRNNNLYPTHGSYFQVKLSTFEPSLGSDYPFTSSLIDLRHYHSISRARILAFRGLIALNNGDPPFQLMEKLGTYLRGYTITRFIDKNLLALQAEYRRPLRGRFGMVTFVGFGQVSDKIKAISFNQLKPAAGIGLRFALIPEQKVNLRIDMGFGKDDSSFDINIMEVF